jgi:uncharacterized spore protein YtfJ
MSNNVSEILKNIVGELKEMARSQSVIGEPINLGGKTVIPLVKVSVGFGAGGAQTEKQSEGTNFGGGGGGGAKVEPAAFIIIDGDKISLLSAKPGKYDSLIESVPALLGKLIDLKSSKESKPESGSGNPYGV